MKTFLCPNCERIHCVDLDTEEDIEEIKLCYECVGIVYADYREKKRESYPYYSGYC